MDRSSSALIWWIFGIIVVAATALAIWFYGGSTPPTPTTADDTAAIAQLFTDFGNQMESVSLLAPNASSTIASAYGQYVDPALIARWEADPESAPGRLTSSPWPDRIEVSDITPSGESYIASGTIVLMTSTGEAGRQAFVATVLPQGDRWYITDFTLASSTTP